MIGIKGIICKKTDTIKILHNSINNPHTYFERILDNDSYPVGDFAFSGEGIWQLSSGTYTYKFKQLIDNKRNLSINFTSTAEFSCTEGGFCPIISSFKPYWPIRIYRKGPNDATYTKYIDAFIMNFSNSKVIDNGIKCLGQFWNDIQEDEEFTSNIFLYDKGYYNGENIVIWRPVRSNNLLPSNGSWKKGDIIYTSLPVEGEPLGYICTTNGSPGTWIPINNYSFSS